MSRAGKNKISCWVVVLSAVIFVLIIGSLQDGKVASVKFHDNVSITAKIADTPYARGKGLMFVQSLPENSGMFFIFDYPQILRFWMKNTLMPLDMIFVSENFTVVNIAESAQPCSNYCPLYYSASPSKYVIETNAGFAEKNGIRTGDEVTIIY